MADGYRSFFAYWIGGAANGEGIAALYDHDAVKFTHSERQNKAIQAGFIPKAIGSSTTVKAVKR